MSGIASWPYVMATGPMRMSGVTGVFFTASGEGNSTLDLLAEVQGIVKQAGLTATKVFQHPGSGNNYDQNGVWQPWKSGAIEVHLIPGTTPEQAQAAVDAVFAKMPKDQKVSWHYDIVPLGEFDEEAERARAAFAEAGLEEPEEDGDGAKGPQ